MQEQFLNYVAFKISKALFPNVNDELLNEAKFLKDVYQHYQRVEYELAYYKAQNEELYQKYENIKKQSKKPKYNLVVIVDDIEGLNNCCDGCGSDCSDCEED